MTASRSERKRPTLDELDQMRLALPGPRGDINGGEAYYLYMLAILRARWWVRRDHVRRWEMLR